MLYIAVTTLLAVSAAVSSSLVLHLVAHSHDDTGWVKTVDQYYLEEVRWILDSVTRTLEDFPSAKFSYVEMAYFYRWWKQQSAARKKRVLALLQSKRLQLNLAGWCSNDEATVSGSAAVRQMSDGHAFALSQLGFDSLPRVAWNVDPFGHSYVTAALMAQSGFDAFAMARVSKPTLARLKNEKKLEFLWKGSTTLDGGDSLIFTHVLANHYCTPGFVAFFASAWNPPTLNWDSSLACENNLHSTARQLVAEARSRARYLTHEHVLFPWGCDFKFQNALFSFTQMDKVVQHINDNADYFNATAKFSTVADYISDVHSLNLTWPVFSEDLFVYQSGAHTWWSGYFSSKPWLKQFVRSRENVLRTAELLYAFSHKGAADVSPDNAHFANISKLRRAVDVAQHHDAVTGTETEEVAEDYARRLLEGSAAAGATQESLLSAALSKDGARRIVRLKTPIAELSSEQVMVVVVFNSLAWAVSQLLALPSNRSDVVVYGQSAADGSVALLPKQQIAANNPQYNATSFGEVSSKYKLYFIADELPPLGYATYYVKLATERKEREHLKKTAPTTVQSTVHPNDNSEDFKVGSGGIYTLHFDGGNGLLKRVTNHALRESYPLRQWLQELRPSGGHYNDGSQPSGAYVFRPAQDCKFSLPIWAQSKGGSQTWLNFWRPFDGGAVDGVLSSMLSFSGGVYRAGVCGIRNEVTQFRFLTERLTDATGFSVEKFQFTYFDSSLLSAKQAFDDDYKHWELNGKHFGSMQVDASAVNSADGGNTVEVTVDLSAFGFAKNPLLFSSIRTHSCQSSATGQFYSTLKSISPESAVVYVTRVDGQHSDELLALDYVVFEATAVGDSVFESTGFASFNLQKHGRGQVSNFGFDLRRPLTSVFEPVVFYQLSLASPLKGATHLPGFYSTLQNATSANFSLSILAQEWSESLPTAVDYSVDYWLFERPLVSDRNAGQKTGGALSDAVTNRLSVGGAVFDELQQVFREGYAQTWKVFNADFGADLRYVDLAMHLGPVNGNGSELLASFKSQRLANARGDASFDTCQNALEFVRRRYDATLDERIAANTYASASQTRLRLENGALLSAVLNRAYGSFVAPLNVWESAVASKSAVSDEFHILLQRRELQDDGFGVEQVLDDCAHIEVSARLSLDHWRTGAWLNRRLQLTQQFAATAFYALSASVAEWSKHSTRESALKRPLPENVHLAQLRYAYGNGAAAVVQLQHLFESSDPSPQRDAVSLRNLTDWFQASHFAVRRLTEMQLTGAVPLNRTRRLAWNALNATSGKVQAVDLSLTRHLIAANGAYDLRLPPRHFATLLANAEPIQG